VLDPLLWRWGCQRQRLSDPQYHLQAITGFIRVFVVNLFWNLTLSLPKSQLCDS
jgi:hypothetical protein